MSISQDDPNPMARANARRPADHRRSSAAWQVALVLGSAVVAWGGLRWWKTSLVVTPRAIAVRSLAPSSPALVAAPSPTPEPEGMAWIPGGEFSMGADDPRASPHGGPDPMNDARPVHRVSLLGFWIDRTEVTNDEFARFVAATGHVTVAERVPTSAEFPGAPPENLVAGSVVFQPPASPVPLDNHLRWWAYVPGANWRHPEGPKSSIEGRGAYPVVQVAYPDAQAFARWAKKRLPTEAEWEFAARGGLEAQPYAWGDLLKPDDHWMANIWQGRFPVQDLAEDGYAGVAPVGKFPPNGFGLLDMAGNVWEWCSDWYRPDTYARDARAGPVVANPQGPSSGFDPAEPDQAKRVHRGGSYLCSDQYCTRYMVGTRGKGEVSTSSNHLGFRCVKDPY